MVQSLAKWAGDGPKSGLMGWRWSKVRQGGVVAKHGERVGEGVAILGPALPSSFFSFASSRSCSLSPSLCAFNRRFSLCPITTHSSIACARRTLCFFCFLHRPISSTGCRASPAYLSRHLQAPNPKLHPVSIPETLNHKIFVSCRRSSRDSASELATLSVSVSLTRV